jgi:hypothetical protein
VEVLMTDIAGVVSSKGGMSKARHTHLQVEREVVVVVGGWMGGMGWEWCDSHRAVWGKTVFMLRHCCSCSRYL